MVYSFFTMTPPIFKEDIGINVWNTKVAKLALCRNISAILHEHFQNSKRMSKLRTYLLETSMELMLTKTSYLIESAKNISYNTMANKKKESILISLRLKSLGDSSESKTLYSCVGWKIEIYDFFLLWFHGLHY